MNNENSHKLLIPFIILLILGARFYFYFTTPKLFKDGDRVRISTTVRSEPIRYDTSQYLRLQDLKVYLPLYPEISYGDMIIVEGTVEKGSLKRPRLLNVEAPKGGIYKFRNKLLDFYRSSLPDLHYSLIAGVSVGSKSGIDQDFWQALKNSGTAHVVVASGMNVTLVGGFLLNFLIVFFKRRCALVLALCGIWLYAIMSGFDAPIIRAAIMGSIAFSAQVLGRLNFALRALVVSGVVMVFINPSYISDVGFLLSFFATLGLILFENPIRKKLTKVPVFVREDLSTTLAAQIGVVPFLLYFFGKFNILSPLINLFVLWTVVPMTILGMLGGIVGLFVPVVGQGILLLTYPLTLWFIWVVKIFNY